MGRKWFIALIALGVVALIAGAVWVLLNPDLRQAALTGLGVSQPREGRLNASGFIEAEEITLASEIGGRVVENAVGRGDSVAVGDVLLRLDDAVIREQRTQAAAAADEARAALAGAEAQLAMALVGARSEEIDAARSAVRAAEANVALAEGLKEVAELRVEAMREDIEAAQAQIAAARAGLAAAEADRMSVGAARARGEAGATPEEIAIAERQVERARNELWAQQSLRDTVCGWEQPTGEITCDAAQAHVQAAEEVVTIAELELRRVREGLREEDLAALAAQTASAAAGVEGARAQVALVQAQLAAAETAVAATEADVRSVQAQVDAARAERDRAQAGLELVLAGARSEEIDQLRAGVSRAQATLTGAEAAVRATDVRIAQLILTTPIAGEVLHSMVRVGELAPAGTPLLVLGDLRELTLRVYVPQPDLGRVSLGQTVEVVVDAYPDVFIGRVIHITSRAEFTPTHIVTEEERVKMVFAVEIALDNPDLLLKPGMPAEVTFR